MEDYHDFLRTRKFDLWAKDGKESTYVRKMSSGKIAPPKENVINESDVTALPRAAEVLRRAFVGFLETRPADVCANIMICLTNQCNYLLDRQIK